MSMSIDSIEVWPKAEKLIQSVYDDGAECYIVSYDHNGDEVNTPVDEVVMMIMKDVDVSLVWYDCWLSTVDHAPVPFVEHLLFVDKESGEEIYFDVYEAEKNTKGRYVGYELLTETFKYQ